MSNKFSILASLVFLGVVSTPCGAAPLIFQYSGFVFSITSIDGATDTLGLHVGSSVKGSFSFDTDSVDSDPSGTRAFYEDSIPWMRFDGIQSTSATDFYSVFSLDADPLHDRVAAYLSGWTEDNVFQILEFSLESSAPQAILGNDNPDWSSLSLSDFDLSDSRFEFVRATFLDDGTIPRTLISARFTRLEIRQVPEPGTSMLLGFGLAGLGLAKRRRQTPT